MADTTWKQNERAIARRLGGTRTGPSGRSGPDVVTGWLAVEVKARKRLPMWLKSALQQARTGCPPTRLPLVVLHEVGARHDGDLVVMSLQDFEAWFGDGDG